MRLQRRLLQSNDSNKNESSVSSKVYETNRLPILRDDQQQTADNCLESFQTGHIHSNSKTIEHQVNHWQTSVNEWIPEELSKIVRARFIPELRDAERFRQICAKSCRKVIRC